MEPEAHYKSRIYKNYYKTHILPRKGPITLDQLGKSLKVFDFHFSEFLPSDRSARIIDAGCGAGKLVYWLQKRGYHNALGVDDSSDMIEAGKAAGIENLEQCDLGRYLALHRDSFDLIFMRDVLEHIDKADVLNVLETCFQALRPGGTLVLQLPNGASPFVGRVLYGDFTHESAYTESSLSQLLRLAGFDNCRFQPFLPYCPRLTWRSAFTRRGRGAIARQLAWKAARALYAFLIAAEIGRHSTVTTFNLIAAASRTRPSESDGEPLPKGARKHGVRPGEVRALLGRRPAFRLSPRRGLQKVVRALARVLPRPSALPSSGNVRQILVFGDMGIGNLIMMTPTLRILRTEFPNAEIVALLFKGRGAEEVIGRLDSIDRCECIDLPGPARLRQVATLLWEAHRRCIRPDLAVARWNGSPYVAILTTWLRPGWRLGHVSGAGYEGFSDPTFNLPVPMRVEEHEVERNLNLVRRLAIEPGPVRLEFPVTAEDRQLADAAARERRLSFERMVCLQVASSKLQSWKRWPAEHWRELVRLASQYDIEFAFLGSAEESDVVRETLCGTELEGEEARMNLCGKLSLQATGAFLSKARLLVCNDSGLMHVAAAVGTPIIALMGPTEYDRTRPFTDRCVVLRGQCHCNQGTLFDRRTLRAIEACNRPCLSSTLPTSVLAHILEALPPPGEPAISRPPHPLARTGRRDRPASRDRAVQQLPLRYCEREALP